MNRRAFTLIELLVVISIIGLLSTIAIVATNSSRAASRNAKRIADVMALKNALNLAYADNGGFPKSSAGGGNAWACLSSLPSCDYGYSIGTYASLDTIMSTYMATKPTDPKDSTRGVMQGYIYNSNWGGAGTLPTGVTIIYVLDRYLAVREPRIRGTRLHTPSAPYILNNLKYSRFHNEGASSPSFFLYTFRGLFLDV